MGGYSSYHIPQFQFDTRLWGQDSAHVWRQLSVAFIGGKPLFFKKGGENA